MLKELKEEIIINIYMKQFKKGQKVRHSDYGTATVYNIHEASKNAKFSGGIIMTLDTEEGQFLFKQDRGAYLPRCFESDLNKLEIIK